MEQDSEYAEYMAECMWPGVTKADLDSLEARALASAEASAQDVAPVRYLGSVLVPGDEVVFCFFAGPSAQAVESVARRANIPFARVIESVWVSKLTRRS